MQLFRLEVADVGGAGESLEGVHHLVGEGFVLFGDVLSLASVGLQIPKSDLRIQTEVDPCRVLVGS